MFALGRKHNYLETIEKSMELPWYKHKINDTASGQNKQNPIKIT